MMKQFRMFAFVVAVGLSLGAVVVGCSQSPPTSTSQGQMSGNKMGDDKMMSGDKMMGGDKMMSGDKMMGGDKMSKEDQGQ
ncbi:MAG: hypothetical protein JSS02_19450 [Planctomycetes bacterium]|nr:hypothetical protein [Planctomycetota bacterium]